MNNVYHKPKTKTNKGVIGVGCVAHILNNAVKKATDYCRTFNALWATFFNTFIFPKCRFKHLRGFVISYKWNIKKLIDIHPELKILFLINREMSDNAKNIV